MYSELVSELETFLTPVTAHLSFVVHATSGLDSRVRDMFAVMTSFIRGTWNLYGEKTAPCELLQENRHDLQNLLFFGMDLKRSSCSLSIEEVKYTVIRIDYISPLACRFPFVQ